MNVHILKFPSSRLGIWSSFLVTIILIVANQSFAKADHGIWSHTITKATERGVPPTLALAVVKVSSDFKNDLIGDCGETGAFQIMPSIADQLYINHDQLWNVHINVRIGVGLLSSLLQQTHGNQDLALHAWAKLRFSKDVNERTRFVRKVKFWEQQFARKNTIEISVHSRRRAVQIAEDDWVLKTLLANVAGAAIAETQSANSFVGYGTFQVRHSTLRKVPEERIVPNPPLHFASVHDIHPLRLSFLRHLHSADATIDW